MESLTESTTMKLSTKHIALCTAFGLLASCRTVPPAAAPSPIPAVADNATWDRAANAPLAVTTKRPVYPFEAWRAHKPGVVRLTFKTDRTGAVTDLQCVESTDALFCKAAMSAVAQWKFSQKNAGPFRLRLRFDFSEGGASIDWR